MAVVPDAGLGSGRSTLTAERRGTLGAMGNDAGNKLEAPRLGFRRRKSSTTESEAPEPITTEKESREQPEKESETASGPRLLNAVVRRAAKPAAEPGTKAEPKAATSSKEPAPAREPREVPISDGPLAAALVGLVVGVFLVAAVWVCEQISQQSRGTTSLGRAGVPLLLAIFVLAVVGGTLLLRLAKTPSPGSISFLATALVAVLALLFIGDRDSLWAGIVVVILAIAAFVLARWVTLRYIDADAE